MSIVKYASVVQECSKIASRNVLLYLTLASLPGAAPFVAYHRKVDASIILESIQQSNKPVALRIGENVSLGEHMSNLVHLEQELLAHDLQSADLARIFLLRKIYLTIPTLTNLRENVEITIS